MKTNDEMMLFFFLSWTKYRSREQWRIFNVFSGESFLNRDLELQSQNSAPSLRWVTEL